MPAAAVKRVFGHVTQTDPLTYAYASMRDQVSQVNLVKQTESRSQERRTKSHASDSQEMQRETFLGLCSNEFRELIIQGGISFFR